MSKLRGILRELLDLFVDDGALAVGILMVVLTAAFLANIPDVSPMAGMVLLFGCLGVLVANVVRAGQR